MSFWAELQRRNVFRVAAAYLVASWLIVQVVVLLTEPLGLPDFFDTIVVVLLAIGFPVALIVTWVYEVTPEGVRTTSDVDAQGPADRQSTQRLTYVIVALLVAAVGLMALDTFVLPDVDTPQQSVAETVDPATAEPESAGDAQSADGPTATETSLTLAVLPFDDASQSGDQGYLADGIAREIRSALSLVDGLSVIGHDTSSLFGTQNADLRSLRDDWAVDYVLEGSVSSADDRLRINVTLTDTGAGTITHSANYERMLDDSFSLLDEIAESAARAMEITLGVGEIGRRPGMTRNAEAFEEYLHGQAIAALSVDALRTVISHYERAVALDETFSLAWYGLYAASTALDGFLQSQGGDPAARQRADEALSRVVDLTPDLPELLLAELARVSTGTTHSVDFFELGRRFDEFSRSAAERDYPYAEIATFQAMFLYATGRIADAIALLERVHAIDPVNRFVVNALSEGYAVQGRTDESFRVGRAYREQTGIFAFEIFGRAVYTALETGDDELIEQRLAFWRQLENATGINALYRRMAELIGQPELALEEIEAFAESANRGPFSAMAAAPWAAYFGGGELALEILAKADLQSVILNIPRPLFADVRRTEDFKEFMKRIGLEPYWRETGNWPDYCRPAGLDDLECF